MSTKFFKKFQSILNGEKIDKITSAIENQLKNKKEENRSEAFTAITLYMQTCKQKSWQFPKEIYNKLIKSIDDSSWIIRRNALNSLRDLSTLYPKEIIIDDTLQELRTVYKKDQNWACRNAAIEALGKIGENIPNRIVPFLTAPEQINDPDSDVRLSILTALKIIYLQNRDKLEHILPIFVKAYKKDEDFRVSTFAEEAIKEFATLKKEEGTAYKKVEVDRINCPHCKESVPSSKKVCQNCGQLLPSCQICNGSIKNDGELVSCPHCTSNFHADHFKEWYAENKNCPVCLGVIDYQG